MSVFRGMLIPGKTYSHGEILNILNTSLIRAGGIILNKERRHIILVTGTDYDAPYQDQWVGDVLLYTGMGKRGDQKLDNRNRALYETITGVSKKYNRVVVLDRQEKGKYVFHGEVATKGGDIFWSRQADQNGRERSVIIFQLIVNRKGDETNGVSEPAIDRYVSTDERLKELALSAPKKPAKNPSATSGYARNPYVVHYTLQRAGGICELCKQPGPFEVSAGVLFLECHHIQWLSREGEDSIENTVALCPNCHRMMHIIDNAEDVTKLINCRKEKT